MHFNEVVVVLGFFAVIGAISITAISHNKNEIARDIVQMLAKFVTRK